MFDSKMYNGPGHNPEESVKWFRNPDWWMVFLTALLFAVGAVTLRVFYRQFGEMQAQTSILSSQAQQAATDSIESAKKVEKQLAVADKQAKAAQDSVKAIQRQMRVDQRPWIRPFTTNTADINLVDNQPISITFRYRNLGKTPAKAIRGAIFIEVVKREEPPKLVEFFTTRRPVIAPDRDFYMTATGILFPDGIMESPISRTRPKPGGGSEEAPLTPTEHADLMAGRSYIAIHGAIGYVDVFDVFHWTRFCSWHSYAQGVFASGKCASYNAVDNRQ